LNLIEPCNTIFASVTETAATTSGEAVIHAQKYCKYAQSALQYEDVPTAIENLEKCLALLKTGK
jgi:vacuolar protein sorting-associated protein VTA1